MIYLAQPYSSPIAEVMEDRFEAACAAVAHLTRKGYIVYSPIAHFHPVAVRHDLPRDFLFWQKINLAMIDHADALYILELEGHDLSVGVQGERKHAALLGLPIISIKDVRRG